MADIAKPESLLPFDEEGRFINPHNPGCQCHAVLCRTARGLIVDGVDLVPMPAPPPPATDTHEPKEPRLAPTLLTALAEALARADKAEAERDAAKRQLVRLQTAFDAATKPDPRIEAWRAMDAADRANTVEDLRTWADLVERGLGDGGTETHRGLFVAAAALEALGEK